MADINKKITFETNILKILSQANSLEKVIAQTRTDARKAAADQKQHFKELLMGQQQELNILKQQLRYQQLLAGIEKERMRSLDDRLRKQARAEQDFWSGKDRPDQTLLQKLGERLSPSRNLGRLIDSSRLRQDEALAKQSKLQDLAEDYRRQAKLLKGPENKRERDALNRLARKSEKDAAEAGAEAAKAGGAATAASTALTVVNTVSRMGKEFAQNFKTVFGFSLSIKDNFADILNNVRKMLDQFSGMATYNTESSLFTNAAARQTRLQYGLSGSQAYGMTQAMSMLGMKNEEDLMYMNARQRGAFINIMEKQAAWQAKMEASGVLESIQEFQLDFEMFKQDIAVQFLQWIAENKDELMGAARTIVKVLKAILTVIAKVLTLFSGESLSYGAGSTTLSDAIASGSVSTDNSRNLNLNQNYTINGAGDNPNNYLGAVQNWADMTVKTVRPTLT